jgi:hypothetical protein
MYNSFDYRGLAVNVEPITDWKEIKIIPIYMGLNREIKPGIGNNTIDALMPDETYVTYWRVQVPVNLSIQAVPKLKFPWKRSSIKPLNQELRPSIFIFGTFGTACIVDLETDEIVYQENRVLGNLITCRYPLLEQITYEYEDRLTSTGALMMETTAFL